MVNQEEFYTMLDYYFVTLLFWAVFLVAVILCSVFADKEDKLGRKDIISVNGTVVNVQYSIEDWRDTASLARDAFQFSESDLTPASSIREEREQEERERCLEVTPYLVCEQTSQRTAQFATGPGRQIEVRDCRTAYTTACNVVTNSGLPRVKTEVTVNVIVNGKSYTKTFVNYKNVYPLAGRDVMEQVPVISEGDTVPYVYREGHEDVTLTKDGDEVPAIREKSKIRYVALIVLAVIFSLIFADLSLLLSARTIGIFVFLHQQKNKNNENV